MSSRGDDEKNYPGSSGAEGKSSESKSSDYKIAESKNSESKDSDMRKNNGDNSDHKQKSSSELLSLVQGRLSKFYNL